MVKTTKRIAVTGGAGQIAYSLLFRIANGEMLGFDQPVALHILELPEAMQALEGVRMELEDCAFPLLKEIKIGSNPLQIFAGIDYALLVGAKPRGPGMERKELLFDNAKIFIEQGKALNEVANPHVKVLVIGNPCNTNCLIALRHAPKISPSNFYAMTRLDQNRAVAQLAKKSNTENALISNVVIWGNHSATQVPDYFHAKINGKKATDVISDIHWLQNDFMSSVQKRGAEIIAARGKSSAASAASACIDAIRDITNPTPKDHWFSTAIYSENNPYDIAKNIVFSFPCRTKEDGTVEIVPNLEWDKFIRSKIKLTEQELLEERELIKSLL